MYKRSFTILFTQTGLTTSVSLIVSYWWTSLRGQIIMIKYGW